MWELDCEESCVPKNWCFWTVVWEKTLESPLGCKEIQPVHPIGDQSWVFIGGTDVEAETLIFWPPDVKSWLIWKDPNAGKDRGWEEKGTTEYEMVGSHHWLNGHVFGWTLGVGDGQGDMACPSSWGRKESDTTEWLNWNWNWWLIWGFPGGASGKEPAYKCSTRKRRRFSPWVGKIWLICIVVYQKPTQHCKAVILQY